MKSVPGEILILIAADLSARDLGNFRLCSRRCAQAGIYFLAKNGFSIVNTSGCLEDFRELLQNKILAKSVREVSLLHEQWPAFSRLEWEINSLYLQATNFSASSLETDYRSAPRPELSDEAFTAYQSFIFRDQRRLSHDHVRFLVDILGSIPNLRTINVSSVLYLIQNSSPRLKYLNFQQSIGLSPFTVDLVDYATQSLLLALRCGLPNVKRLIVRGILNPGQLNIAWSTKLPCIELLHLSTLQIIENQAAVRDFLLTFPNLVKLFITFKGYGSTTIESLYYARLEKLHLGDVWATEQDLFGLFQRHQRTLRSLHLCNPLLIQGSWRSLFARIRSLKCNVLVTGEGEFRQQDKARIKMTPAGRESLATFMNDIHAPWPFCSKGKRF